MSKHKKLLPKLQVWVEARKRFGLSHAHIQMAREMGLNPKKFGKLANHRQERWKAPLPIFIESLYFKRFGKSGPDEVLSIEQLQKKWDRKRVERKARGQARTESIVEEPESNDPF
jgi:hypothetical protein